MSSAGAPASLWTVSYRSENAVHYDPVDRVYTFESGLNRLKSFRMTLVSLEFPVSQRTVEEAFSHFYFSEGLQIGPRGRTIEAVEMVPDLDSTVVIAAVLPLAFQWAAVVAAVGATLTIETRADDRTTPAPHGLFVGPADTCLIDMWPGWAGDESIRLVLPVATGLVVPLACRDVTFVSPTRFDVTLAAAPILTVDLTAQLYAPTIRSPTTAAALVQWVFGLFPTLNSYTVVFDEGVMRTSIEARGVVEPDSSLSVVADDLTGVLAWLGFCTATCTAAGGVHQGVGWLGAAQLTLGGCWPCGDARERDVVAVPGFPPPPAPPIGPLATTVLRRRNRALFPDCADPGLAMAQMEELALPDQGFRPDGALPIGAGPPITVLRRACNRYQTMALQSAMWLPCGRVRIRPGWYAPQVRATGITEPLNLETELEMARLRLAPPPSNTVLPIGMVTFHTFVVETPWGMLLRVPIEVGHYPPQSMAQTLETNTRRAAVLLALPPAGWPAFTVVVDEGMDRFILSDANGLAFGMRFDDPAMFDAHRLGFEQQRYTGSAVYAGDEMVLPRRASRSTEPGVLPPPPPPGTTARACSGCSGWPVNWYSVTDGGVSRQFHFTGHPPRTVRIKAASAPVAPPGNSDMLLQTFLLYTDTGGGTAVVPFALPFQLFDEVVLSDLQTGQQHWGVVLGDAGESGLDGAGVAIKLITVYAPGIIDTDVGVSGDWTLQPTPSNSPFSLAFPIPDQACVDLQAVYPRLYGFPAGATLWRLDHDNQLIAANLMDLDHVDYVNMDLGWNFLRKTDTYQSAGRYGNTVGFAKLVLYPQYQVHGLLPRDLVTATMDSPVRFEVRFLNPDNTPYHFNGREFSFSLQYTSPLGTQ